MADHYWNRQPPMHPSAGLFKRQRLDYDIPPSGFSAHDDMRNHLARDENRLCPGVMNDTKQIDLAYNEYLKNKHRYSFKSGEDSNYKEVGLGRAAVGKNPASSMGRDPVSMGHPGGDRRDLVQDSKAVEYGVKSPVDETLSPARDIRPLPADATHTLYVEGLPPDSTRREVAHIFRPFVGFKEVRLVYKESKHHGGYPLILCFVDFENPACAATAMAAMQGYKMDEYDDHSAYLRLQFSKHPGPRSSSGYRGRR